MLVSEEELLEVRQEQKRLFRQYILRRILKRTVISISVVRQLQKQSYIRKMMKELSNEMGLSVYERIDQRQIRMCPAK